ncbi:hypothetical protein [Aquimarina celericrescens]|uniref:Uncharacterized protein n=1 Tax=Aquimarina celericrescens TaxID=1964542 RepID=A0ABW5AU39_9FLAO|nr:hypothetical protein [Aquimarina celericrescens]
MKTIKNVWVALALILVYACDADDDTGIDESQPRFSFRISGDGFSRTFTNDDDLENIQLNLKHDADYEFIFSGGDTGGTKLIQMQYPTDYIEFDTTPFPPAPWEQTFPSGSLSGIIFWEGDPSNPITGNILNGTLRPNGELVSITLYFRVEDFGGEARTSNVTDGSLQILIDDHPTELINLN